MKPQIQARDVLYSSMDNLINYNKENNHKMPWITLDSAQYQIFTDFNEPEGDAYFYKKILVRCLS